MHVFITIIRKGNVVNQKGNGRDMEGDGGTRVGRCKYNTGIKF